MVATAFLLLTFAIIQYAMAVYAYNAVAEAASEAARYAAAHSPSSPSPATNAQVQTVAINSAPNLKSGLTVNVSYPADPNIPAKSDAKVQVTYTYNLSVPFLTTVKLTLNGAAQMLVSQ